MESTSINAMVGRIRASLRELMVWFPRLGWWVYIDGWETISRWEC